MAAKTTRKKKQRPFLPRTQVTSVVAYDGVALRGGEMDVRDLAPALLAIGDLVRDANRRLNGDRADIRVSVKSRFKKGSFGVTITLLQTLGQYASNLISAQTFHDAVMLAKLLGLTVLGEKPKEVVENIFELLKFLGGEEPKEKESTPDGVTIVNQRGETTIVNSGTLVLIQDNSIRNDVKRMLAPLNSPGIDTFQTREQRGDVVEQVSKQELPSVLLPTKAALPEATAEQLLETRTTGLFQVVSPVFRENNKWRVNAGHGDFWAEIADPVFLNKIHRREIGFFEGDLLKAEYVNVATRQAGKIESEIRLVNVLEVIPGVARDVQVSFPASSGD